jgi:hypothetical protein
VRAINGSFEEERLDGDILDRAFDRWWPDLEKEIASLEPDVGEKRQPAKSTRGISEEVLLNTREIMRQMSRSPIGSRDRRGMATLVNLNQAVATAIRISLSEEYSDVIPQLQKMSEQLLKLNSALGKTAGGSLKNLKEAITQLALPAPDEPTPTSPKLSVEEVFEKLKQLGRPPTSDQGQS